MKRAIPFLFLSSLSYFGDTLFLFGIPLYLYKISGEVTETTYIGLAISLAILITRPLIVKANLHNPLKIVAYGEILMAILELFLIVAFIVLGSRWVLIAGVFPLAIVYNFFYVAKNYKLQDYFFDKDSFYLTSLKSAFDKFGQFAGMILSGIFVVNYEIYYLIFIDLLSFLVFGLFILSFYKKDIKTGNAHREELEKISGVSPKVIFISMVMAVMASYFMMWDRGTSTSIASKLLGLNLDIVIYFKVLTGGAGLLLGVFFSKYFRKSILYIWLSSILIATVGGLLTYGEGGSIAFFLIFFSGGILTSLTTPILRDSYLQIELNGGNRAKVEANQFVYTSLFTISLTPMTYLLEHYQILNLNLLQSSTLFILLLGGIGGGIIYWILRKDICVSTQ